MVSIWQRSQRRVAKILNRFGANLEICAQCGRLTRWSDDRLWGPFLYCPPCDQKETDLWMQAVLGESDGE